MKHYRDALQNILSDAGSSDENRSEALVHLQEIIDTKNLPKDDLGKLEKFVQTQKETMMQKSVDALKGEIKKQPFSVEKSIRNFLAQPN